MTAFMKLTNKFVFLGLLFCPLLSLAELPKQVQDDFSVVEGVVVMPINNEYIVDLDDRDNLYVGDILTLVKTGRNIFHPITNEVIGTVDEAIGFLQVTRIHSGYSYAMALTEGMKPANGAPLKRFEQVPAFLVAENPVEKELGRQLQVNLPQFQWLDDSNSAKALLSFNLQGGALNVKTAQGNLLHKYVVTEDQQLVSTTKQTQRPYGQSMAEPEPGALQKLANTLIGSITETTDDRFAEIDEAIIKKKLADRKGIWMGPNLGSHPSGLAVADLDGDGQMEVAVALEKKILIARITEGQFNEVAEVDVPSVLQMLSIDALDMDNDGRSELYLTALGANRASSFVVEYDGSSYGLVDKSQRWLLRVVTLPGEEKRTLVGQRIENTVKVFKDDVFRVERKGGELVQGAPIGLPEQLNLFNFIPFTDDSNKHNFLYLTNGDYLNVISAEGKKLWGSDDYYGGSEDCFTLKDAFRDEIQIPTCMRPRFVMMPNKEILAVQNDGQRVVQRYRRFERSRLVSLSWNGFAFQENWKTASQPGYLSDFALADADNDGKDELVMAVMFNRKGLTEVARASVVIYELE